MFGGFIINRVHPRCNQRVPKRPPANVLDDIPSALWTKLHSNFTDFKHLGESDHRAVESLKRQVKKETPVRCVTLFEDDIHQLNGLLNIRDQLFGNGNSGGL